jgi:hypothetical protein
MSNSLPLSLVRPRRLFRQRPKTYGSAATPWCVRSILFLQANRPLEARQFSEWVLSAQGQLVVEAAEFWPLGAADREQGKTLLAAR